jgi:GMP synthase-like glutamine amidotransferase
MPSILAFRHVPFEGLGRIEPVLHARGCEIHYTDLYVPGAPLPDISRYQALIFLGGPMSVNHDLTYLRREEAYIRQAVDCGIPVLGVCLGAQLIAHAFGAAVRRNPVTEIGWFEIEFTSAARRDPVFAGLTGPETVFHWHGETFDLPPSAELLASSQRCRHQAFRIGDMVYGLQFHLEVTAGMIADWCLQDENCVDVRELDHPIDPGEHGESVTKLAETVFGNWYQVVHDRTAPDRL